MISALFVALVLALAAARPDEEDLEHVRNFALLSTFQVRGRIDGKAEATTEVVRIPRPVPSRRPDETPGPVEEPRTVTVERPYPVPVPIYVGVPVYVRVPGNHLEGLLGSYVPSKAGGTYRAGFNEYQTVDYRKTW